MSNVIEDVEFTVTINTTNIEDGTTLPYSVLDIPNGFFKSGSDPTHGTITVNGNTASLAFTIASGALNLADRDIVIRMDDYLDSFTIRAIAAYSLTGPTTGVNEDGSFTINLETFTIPDGSHAYTITGLEPEDITSGNLTGNFVTVNNQASITVQMFEDRLTEGKEAVTVTLDGKGVSYSFNIIDTSIAPTYTLSSDIEIVDENDNNVLTITLDTQRVLDNVTVPYTVTGISAADLISGSLQGNFTVVNNTDSISFTFDPDQITEGGETFSLTLNTPDSDGFATGEPNISVAVTDSSQAPTFSLSTVSANEGQTLTVTLTTSDVEDGTTVGYTTSGLVVDDISAGDLSGTFTINNNTSTISFTLAEDQTTEGFETFEVIVDANDSAGFATGSPSGTQTIVDTSTYPTYVWSAPASVNEGATFTISLNTTNVFDNVTIPYTITGITANDLTAGSLTGNVTIVDNIGNISLTLNADKTTEGTESLLITAGATDSDGFATSSPYKTITINDTSPDPYYGLSSSTASLDEGGTFSVTLTTVSVDNGTVVPYTVTGITAADLSSGSMTGSFTVGTDTTKSFTLVEDFVLENETFILTLDNVTPSTSVSVGVTDTVPSGSQYFGVSGTFTVPAGVNTLSVALVGAGGGGGGGRGASGAGIGGGGGGFAKGNNLVVTPGETISVYVGTGGGGGTGDSSGYKSFSSGSSNTYYNWSPSYNTSGSNGGTSFLMRGNTVLIQGNGGAGSGNGGTGTVYTNYFNGSSATANGRSGGSGGTGGGASGYTNSRYGGQGGASSSGFYDKRNFQNGTSTYYRKISYGGQGGGVNLVNPTQSPAIGASGANAPPLGIWPNFNYANGSSGGQTGSTSTGGVGGGGRGGGGSRIRHQNIISSNGYSYYITEQGTLSGGTGSSGAVYLQWGLGNL